MPERAPFVAFNEGRVLIDGGDVLGLPPLGIQLGNALHPTSLNLLQALDGLAGRKDKALLVGACRSEFLQFRVVEAFQKLAQCGGLGRGVDQTPFQAGIIGQELNVFGTLSTHGLQQDRRLDHLAFIMAAFAFAQREIGLDQGGQAQGTIGPGDGQQASVGTGGFLERARIEDERSFVQ